MKFMRLRNSKETLKTQRELEDKNQLLPYIWNYTCTGFCTTSADLIQFFVVVFFIKLRGHILHLS